MAPKLEYRQRSLTDLERASGLSSRFLVQWRLHCETRHGRPGKIAIYFEVAEPFGEKRFYTGLATDGGQSSPTGLGMLSL